MPESEAKAIDKNIRWDKAPCRFCGTGCSVLVGTQNGRVVATQGQWDEEALLAYLARARAALPGVALQGAVAKAKLPKGFRGEHVKARAPI